MQSVHFNHMEKLKVNYLPTNLIVILTSSSWVEFITAVASSHWCCINLSSWKSRNTHWSADCTEASCLLDFLASTGRCACENDIKIRWTDEIMLNSLCSHKIDNKCSLVCSGISCVLTKHVLCCLKLRQEDVVIDFYW